MPFYASVYDSAGVLTQTTTKEYLSHDFTGPGDGFGGRETSTETVLVAVVTSTEDPSPFVDRAIVGSAVVPTIAPWQEHADQATFEAAAGIA